MAYSSIMTLLLAFFIILQAFAPEPSEGLYHAGRGSFVRALRTFGLGGLWDRVGGKMRQGTLGPRYLSPEGQTGLPGMRRIDPELEEAQLALEELEDRFDVRKLEDATGYRVELTSPCSYGPGKTEMTPEEEQFLAELGPRLERVVLARGFVVRIGTVIPFLESEELERTRSALAAAHRVRSRLIEHMSPSSRETAARRIYSFFRWESAEAGQESPELGQLKVDILLTKPHLEYPKQEGEGGSETRGAI